MIPSIRVERHTDEQERCRSGMMTDTLSRNPMPLAMLRQYTAGATLHVVRRIDTQSVSRRWSVQ